MRPSIKIALLFAGIWFTGKMLFFYLQILQDPDSVKFLVMWNILCLLLGMTIGTMIEFRGQDRSQNTALGDIRKVLGGGVMYTVIVSLLLYLYYAKVDPGYNQQQIAMAIERDEQYLSDPEKFAAIRQEPDYLSLSKEEILQKRRSGYKQVFSAGSTMTMSMLGLLLLSVINAIVLTIVFRRVLFRQRTL
jgi:hypothetical protein